MFIEFHRYVPLDFLFDRSCIASLKEWGQMQPDQPVGFQLPWPTLQGSLFRCRCEHRSYALPELQKSNAENDTLISGHCVNCRKYGHGTAKRHFWQSNIAKWSLAHLLAVKHGNCFFHFFSNLLDNIKKEQEIWVPRGKHDAFDSNKRKFMADSLTIGFAWSWFLLSALSAKPKFCMILFYQYHVLFWNGWTLPGPLKFYNPHRNGFGLQCFCSVHPG